MTKRKNKPRANQNTLIFGVPSSKGSAHLRDQIKEYLALQEIETEIRTGENEGLESKVDEVKDRLDEIKGDFSYNVRKMYNTIQVGDREIDLGMPTAGRESVSNWYRQQLENEEEILVNLHYRWIVNKFLADREVLETKKVLEQFYKDTSSPMINDDSLVKTALARGVKNGQIGIGQRKYEGIDPDSLLFNEDISKSKVSLSESEVIISKDRAEKLTQQTLEEETEEKEGSAKQGKTDIEVNTDTETKAAAGKESNAETGQAGVKEETEDQEPSEEKRYKKVSLKIDEIPTSKIADLNRGVIRPLTRAIGRFNINVEIDIEDEEGVEESVLEDQVKETIRQLQAKIIDEELE